MSTPTVSLAPGSHRPSHDRWDNFSTLVQTLPPETLAVVDSRVAKLHPSLVRQLKKAKALDVFLLPGGERAKNSRTLGRILEAGIRLTRRGGILCVGGGTLGDVCTVAAHVLKRGVRLIQVPSTLLAAVDSSLGGKGALDLTLGRTLVKNAMGVFHYADETWICPELFETLSPRQLREGAIEAWKMVVTLDTTLWSTYRRFAPSREQLIRDARALKEKVCEEDPYEKRGTRRVLNFGHTFGHVIESISRFTMSHGDAVGMGMLCALDVGRAMGLTPEPLALDVEQALYDGPGVLPRSELAKVISRSRITPPTLRQMLSADKKNERAGELTMVLLSALGETHFVQVGQAVWAPLWKAWHKGTRP